MKSALRTLGTILAATAIGLTSCKDKGHDVRGPEHMNLTFRTREGIVYSLGLNRYSDRVAVLDSSLRESRMRFREGQGYESRIGDTLVLDNSADFTRVVRYSGLDTVHNIATFDDYAGGRWQASYNDTTKQGNLVLSGTAHPFTADEGDGRLAIDHDGDGHITDNEAYLHASDGSRMSERDLQLK